MVRASLGPRNRTHADVLWTRAGHRNALNYRAGLALPGRSATLGVIREVLDLFLGDSELLLIGVVAGAIFVSQDFVAVGVRLMRSGAFVFHAVHYIVAGIDTCSWPTSHWPFAF